MAWEFGYLFIKVIILAWYLPQKLLFSLTIKVMLNMSGAFKKSWLSFLIQGSFNLISGILLIITKDPTVKSMTEILGVFAFASAVALLLGAISGRKDNEHWWFLLQSGSLQFVLFLLFFSPLDNQGLKLILSMGICAIVIGISTIVASLKLREELPNEKSLLVMGIISLLFGTWIVLFPGDGLLGKKWHVATYLSCFGLATMYLSYKLWNLGREMNTPIRSLRNILKERQY